MASSITTYRVVTLVANSPYNFVTGTTATSTGNASPANKGVTVNFQNQSTSTGSIAYIGGSDVTISVGATSTTGVGGIKLYADGSYTIEPRHAPSAINMQDWFVCSTSSNCVVVAEIVKAV